MKTNFFPKLAWNGIIKNKKIYIPYIISCMGVLTMYFIMQSLSVSPILETMRGGSNVAQVLSLGKFVIMVFSALFLLYTNSFLTKSRYKEFGLYNILGMGKKDVNKVVILENLFVSIISIIGGLGFGILFSKLSELALLYFVKADIDYGFHISPITVRYSLEIYGILFILLAIISIIRVSKTNPLDLLHSENHGEKPPKANWFFALLGAIILIASYYLAVSIKQPLTALITFFIAVIMVIVATYLLFMAGSVALCKILQKNKSYYYNKKHFVPVASMTYRMKRNGAGLASICILATMVLVMIGSAGSLYIGAEDSINSRYPYQNDLQLTLPTIESLNGEEAKKIDEIVSSTCKKNNIKIKESITYNLASVGGEILSDGTINTDADAAASLTGTNLRSVYFVSQDDYNRIMGTSLNLKDGECALYTSRASYDYDKLVITHGPNLKITERLSDFFTIGEANAIVIPSLFVVIPSFDVLHTFDNATDYLGGYMLMLYHCNLFTPESSVSADASIRNFNETYDNLQSYLHSANLEAYGLNCENSLAEKDDFYSTFGGLFFLAIILSIMFIAATTLIIYYKQLSEGFEDQAKFEIMKKVGMTKEDIKKSIDSQVLTVFFAPMVMAGIHQAFAFPMYWKIIQLFGLTNLSLAIITSVVAFIIFSIFYLLIYKKTAKVYYNIVSE